MIDHDRFWAGADEIGEDDWAIGDDFGEARPGVTAEAIADWEARHGVTLPEPLRTVLKARDGGLVRNANFQILPLREIKPVDDDFWDYPSADDVDAPDHSLLFTWALGDASFLMNFNADGPHGQPSVYAEHHSESAYPCADTLLAFFDDQFATDPEPSIDWAEAEAQPDIVARLRVEVGYVDAGRATLDQVLARSGDALELFTRELGRDLHRLTHATLPLPLDPSGTSIQALRPAPDRTFALTLRPVGGGRSRESTRLPDGRWKNDALASEGLAKFEATDPKSLKDLRAKLLGAEAADRASAEEAHQEAELARLQAMSPLDRQADMMQQILAMYSPDERQALLSGSPEEFARLAAEDAAHAGMPPELADAAAAVRRRFAEAFGKIRGDNKAE